MLEVKDVDIYVGGELRVEGVALNYDAFDLDSEEPQSVTATGFLPCEDAFTKDKALVIDFRDGVYAMARIVSCMRLCDEYQCEMRVIDAARSMDELLSNDNEGLDHEKVKERG